MIALLAHGKMTPLVRLFFPCPSGGSLFADGIGTADARAARNPG
jgi:hypothetical protein